MIPFNPFNKPIEQIEPHDLDLLCSVQEGWYVEYKSLVPNASSIAKSISAFANHYGGWLFYGIEGSRDGHNMASKFLGVPKVELAGLQERVRNAANTQINPTPYYDWRIINGPCSEIGLSENNAIIVVIVPEGAEAPYIHSSGRIYRRKADSSEPVSENNRAVLDLLWERSLAKQNKLTEFLSREPVLSVGEEDTSFIRIFLMSDVLGDRGLFSQIQFEEFARIMRERGNQPWGFECDNIYSASDGFIARQVSSNVAYNKVFTWHHYFDGSSVIDIPMKSARIDYYDLADRESKYKYFEDFLNICKTYGLENAFMLDVNILLPILVGSLEKQQRLIEAGRITSSVFCKAKLVNVWRRIPFLDSYNYIQFTNKFGVPVIQDSAMFCPSGTNRESLVELSYITQNSIDEASGMLGRILMALGLGGILSEDKMGRDLIEAATRGTEVYSGSA